jgi:hypothetical protein
LKKKLIKLYNLNNWVVNVDSANKNKYNPDIIIAKDAVIKKVFVQCAEKEVLILEAINKQNVEFYLLYIFHQF